MLKKKNGIKQKGQTMVEYLLLIAVIALGVMVGLRGFKNQIADGYNTVGCEIKGAAKVIITPPQ